MNTRSRPRVLENNQFHRIGVVGEWVPISPNFLTKCVIWAPWSGEMLRFLNRTVRSFFFALKIIN